MKSSFISLTLLHLKDSRFYSSYNKLDRIYSVVKCKSGQVRSVGSVKYVTQHKRIYINIGKKKLIRKNKMCNNIKCTGQYTVDLINDNISRDVQEI